MIRPALRVRGLNFSYRQEPVLKNVSFDVQEGEYVSIIGPNGAGKSTLIKCIDRILAGWGGEISLFGESIASMSQRRLAGMVGYVPQAGWRSILFTVEEFVLMGRYPQMGPFTFVRREDRAFVEEIFRQTRLSPLAERPMSSLSGGERQLVFIAAALAQGAKILLLDEPTAFLDYGHQVGCLDLLSKMNREQGVTLLSVTHDINQAVGESDRVLAFRGGELFFQGTPSALLSGKVAEKLYGTRFSVYTSQDSDRPVLLPIGGAL